MYSLPSYIDPRLIDFRQHLNTFRAFSLTHRTNACFDVRLLTMMTDTGFFVRYWVGYNFPLAKLLEKPSGTL